MSVPSFSWFWRQLMIRGVMDFYLHVCGFKLHQPKVLTVWIEGASRHLREGALQACADFAGAKGRLRLSSVLSVGSCRLRGPRCQVTAQPAWPAEAQPPHCSSVARETGMAASCFQGRNGIVTPTWLLEHFSKSALSTPWAFQPQPCTLACTVPDAADAGALSSSR